MSFRPTIRLRLTAWFAGLVLVSGAALLTASYLLAIHQINSYPSQVNTLAEQLGFPPSRTRGNAVRQGFPELPTRAQLEQLKAQSVQERRARATAEQQVGVTTKRSLFFELGGLLAGFALVALGVGLFVTRRALAPVARITSAAQRVGEGSLGERLRLDGPDDELKELADTFDQMLDRVEGALARERAFIANASHELRTPLAIIQAEIDAARSGPGMTDGGTARSFEVIEAAVARSGRLLESLFALARANRRITSWTQVGLPELVEDALRDREPALEALGLSLRTELRLASACGDPTLLSQLVGNLVDNAVHHNRAGGELMIATEGDDRSAMLTIENDGPPLSNAHVAHLTEPFARGPQSPTDERSGLGLGLTLAESIAHAHGGAIELTTRQAGGLRVVVRLPTIEPTAQVPRSISLASGPTVAADGSTHP